MSLRFHHLSLPLALAPSLLVGACTMPASGPYETGLTVTTQATEERVTRSYLIREGDGEPMERKGTLSYGDDCNEAGSSTGTRTVTEVGTTTRTWEVIGQTESDHPLVPGTETYGSAGVSVVEALTSFEGEATVHETYRDPNGAVSSYEETSTAEIARTNQASYQGFSSDEYVIGLNSLGDLWGDLHNPEADLGVHLVTRSAAQQGDIWASLDGQMLYLAEGFEEITLAGDKAQAMRVDVRTVADPDPAAGNLVDKCVAEAVQAYVTNHPDLPNGSTTTATLDVACDGAFTHQEVGTEWWVGNVLVQASKQQYEVAINAYGYEWFEDDGVGCSRVISPTRDRDNATLFIEYTVTTITTDLNTDRYEVVSGE